MDTRKATNDYDYNYDLTFNWNLAEYNTRILLSIGGEENQVKKIARDFLLGDVSHVMWIKKMESKTDPRGYAQFDVVFFLTEALIKTFQYLAQEHNEIPNFDGRFAEGELTSYNLGEKRYGKATPFFVAKIALQLALKQVEENHKLEIAPYTYKDVMHVYGHCKVGEQLLFDDERKLLEEDRNLRKKQCNSNMISNNFFTNANNNTNKENQEEHDEKSQTCFRKI